MIDYIDTERTIYGALIKAQQGKVLVERMETNKSGTTYRHKHWINPDEINDKTDKVIGGFDNLPKDHPHQIHDSIHNAKFSNNGERNSHIEQQLGMDRVLGKVNNKGQRYFQAGDETYSLKQISDMMKDSEKKSPDKKDSAKKDKPKKAESKKQEDKPKKTAPKEKPDKTTKDKPKKQEDKPKKAESKEKPDKTTKTEPKKQEDKPKNSNKLHKLVQNASYAGDYEGQISEGLGYDGIQQAVYSMLDDNGKKEFQIIELKDDDDDAEIKHLTPKEMSDFLYKKGVKESEFEEDDLKPKPKPKIQFTGNKDTTSISNISGKVLKSTKEAQKYFGMSTSGNTRFSRFNNEISEKQQDCFKGYTMAEDRFYMLNFFFRKFGDPAFGDLRPEGYYEDDFKAFKMISKNMDTAISKFELDEPIQVYRLVSNYGVEDFLNEIKKAYNNGTTFTDPAYASTSVVDGSITGIEEGFKFEITVPAGKGYGAWIAPYSPERYTEQNEFLLARGTKFKVLTDMNKLDVKSPGIKTIKLQVVENEQEPVENFENYFRRRDYVAPKEDEEHFIRNGLGFSLKEAITEN